MEGTTAEDSIGPRRHLTASAKAEARFAERGAAGFVAAYRAAASRPDGDAEPSPIDGRPTRVVRPAR